jgi:predicted XRE-type DNA-binding protein
MHENSALLVMGAGDQVVTRKTQTLARFRLDRCWQNRQHSKEWTMARMTRPISWMAAARREFDGFPQEAREAIAIALTVAADGGKPDIVKPMKGMGSGIERGIAMKDEKLAVIRGSGNVFRDLGIEHADALQLKALLAAEIIKKLDKQGLSVRKAQALTGIDAGDFSRIRNADFRRMTVERLMAIVNRLGSQIEFKMRLRPIPARCPA